jgi:type I restriction enzyme M protein
MVVIRRLDAVLEPTKEAVLGMKKNLDAAGVANQEAALRQAAGQAFYNSSPFTLRDLKSRAKVQQLKADFEAYLDGFSLNVQEILDKFEFRNQIPKLVEHDVLGGLIEKFLDHSVNLSPEPVYDSDGQVRLPGLDNHAMGTIFEELIRKFNEENNEEAGEHFTPRDVVKLMAELIFRPIADEVKDGTYTVYDGACGTGGMLTIAEQRLLELAKAHGKQVSVHLFGQEVNAETYAIAKADLLLKGEGEGAENFTYGSTLSADGFPAREFDFMLSNPPFGKSWKNDLEKMGGKTGMKDPRFNVNHRGEDLSLITRSNDGQLMFLVNNLAKMKGNTPLGSRIAEVHNGSSLFTGDAGQGESNIRRWIIESDWLEAIIALPLNMFYNTGIATYIWVLTNRKPEHRKGKVQLIDATAWFQPLRKNLGKKNCEFGDQHIQQVVEAFLDFKETEQSKLFRNEDFGYWKVVVERPLRLKGIDPTRAYSSAEIKKLKEAHERSEDAPPVIRKIHKTGKEVADPLNGLFEVEIGGKKCVVEYEPDSELRDTENVPLLEEGGIQAFIEREVLPHVPDAWVQPDKTEIGYEISFTRYFYKPKPMRTLEEIRRDIEALEKETEGLLDEVLVEVEA